MSMIYLETKIKRTRMKPGAHIT